METTKHQNHATFDKNEEHLDYRSFSYATDQDPFFKRLIIRSIEKLTGQIRIWRLYNEYKNEKRSDNENFWDAACRKLDLDLEYNSEKLNQMPTSGPLVVVANHPYGVLDGLILCRLMAMVRPDFKVLTNSVLTRSPEVKDNLLPVDFSGTKEALEINLASRKAARETLQNGGAVAVFPAGGVSNITKLGEKDAQDAPWQPFVGQLVKQNKSTVLPLYFHGQNSRIFQLASLTSQTLRLSLFFRELACRIGTTVRIEIGDPISYAELEKFETPAELVVHLRHKTYELGKNQAHH